MEESFEEYSFNTSCKDNNIVMKHASDHVKNSIIWSVMP